MDLKKDEILKRLETPYELGKVSWAGFPFTLKKQETYTMKELCQVMIGMVWMYILFSKRERTSRKEMLAGLVYTYDHAYTFISSAKERRLTEKNFVALKDFLFEGRKKGKRKSRWVMTNFFDKERKMYHVESVGLLDSTLWEFEPQKLSRTELKKLVVAVYLAQAPFTGNGFNDVKGFWGEDRHVYRVAHESIHANKVNPISDVSLWILCKRLGIQVEMEIGSKIEKLVEA